MLEEKWVEVEAWLERVELEDLSVVQVGLHFAVKSLGAFLLLWWLKFSVFSNLKGTANNILDSTCASNAKHFSQLLVTN